MIFIRNLVPIMKGINIYLRSSYLMIVKNFILLSQTNIGLNVILRRIVWKPTVTNATLSIIVKKHCLEMHNDSISVPLSRTEVVKLSNNIYPWYVGLRIILRGLAENKKSIIHFLSGLMSKPESLKVICCLLVCDLLLCDLLKKNNRNAKIILVSFITLQTMSSYHWNYKKQYSYFIFVHL